MWQIDLKIEWIRRHHASLVVSTYKTPPESRLGATSSPRADCCQCELIPRAESRSNQPPSQSLLVPA
jgi:hypothetical protein